MDRWQYSAYEVIDVAPSIFVTSVQAILTQEMFRYSKYNVQRTDKILH